MSSGSNTLDIAIEHFTDDDVERLVQSVANASDPAVIRSQIERFLASSIAQEEPSSSVNQTNPADPTGVSFETLFAD